MYKKIYTNINEKRLFVVKILMTFIIPGVIIIRLFLIHIWNYENFLPLIERQIITKINTRLPRGDILDRNYRILATTLEFEDVSINLQEFTKCVKNPRDYLNLISQTLDIPYNELLRKLSNARYVKLKKKVDIAKSYKLKKIPGLDFVRYHHRVYPQKELCSHIIGGVDSAGNPYSGVELEYDKYLNSVKHKQIIFYRNGKISQVSFRLAQLDDITDIDSNIKNCSLVLTIDVNLQYKINKILESYYLKFSPKRIVCIIQDPENGEIIAMNVFPPIDPPLTNPAINMIFEPGSIFKIFPLAIFLSENVVKSDSIIDCENGEYHYGGHKINDVHPHKYLTVKDIIVYSSNIGMSKLYLMFNDPFKYSKWLEMFGFGAYTGIDLPAEEKGIFVTYKNSIWSKLHPLVMSFGQGIAVTPIQIVNGYTMIANGGKLLQPYVVKYIIDGNNKIVYCGTPRIIREPLSKEIVNTIKDILEETVLRGTAKATKIDGIKICAKTGTAQKFDNEQKRYSRSKYVMSCCGFFPKENPKYVIGVFVDEPKGVTQSSEIAVPIFRDIVLELLSLAEVKYAKAN